MSLQIRRGIESQRTNIVPAVGELLYTTDSNKLYVGDGHTAGGNNILASSAGAGLSWNGTQLVVSGSGLNLSTDVVSEGTTRQYFTIPRAQAAAAAMFTATGSPAVTGTVTGLTSPNLVTLSSSTGIVALEPFIVTGVGGSAYGLTPGTYYVVNPNAGSNQITLASSLANAQAGTAIQTFTTGAPNSVTFSAGGPDSNITFTYNPTAGTISANVQVATIGITSIQQDHSPALGGDLGLNGHSISGTGNISNTGNIVNTGNISTTGTITATTGLGANLILNTFNITGYGSINTTGNISTTGNQSATGTITATTGLGGNLPLNSYGITGTGSINISGAITGTSLSAGVGTISGGALSITTLNASTGLGANLALNGYNISGTGNISNTGNISTSGTITASTGLGANLALNGYNIYGTGNISNTGNISTSGTITATTGLGANLPLNGYNIYGTGNISNTGNIFTSGTITTTTGLGADLPLNSYAISGTGNINITGSITSSGVITSSSAITTTATTASTSTLTGAVVVAGGVGVGGNVNVGNTLFTNAISGNSGNIFLTADTTTPLSITGIGDGTYSKTVFMPLRVAKGTIASPTTTAANDLLGGYSILGFNGSTYKSAAFLLATWDSTAVMTDVYPASIVTLQGSGGGSIQIKATLDSAGRWNSPRLKVTGYATGSYPATPQAGEIIFDSTSKHFFGYNGTAWVQFTGP